MHSAEKGFRNAVDDFLDIDGDDERRFLKRTVNKAMVVDGLNINDFIRRHEQELLLVRNANPVVCMPVIQYLPLLLCMRNTRIFRYIFAY